MDGCRVKEAYDRQIKIPFKQSDRKKNRSEFTPRAISFYVMHFGFELTIQPFDGISRFRLSLTLSYERYQFLDVERPKRLVFHPEPKPSS